MIFENKWKQFLLLENVEEVYQKIIKKDPERKQIWAFFKAKIQALIRSSISAGQYLQWAFSQVGIPEKYNEIVVDGNMSKEDMIMEAIRLFEQNKTGISGSKNILDYDWKGVRTALGNIEGSKREKKRQIKDTGADVLYESNSVSVIHIKTKEASCMYGSGTKWCTAADEDNRFQAYNAGSHLTIIASKENPKNKFQLAIERASGKITDAMDAEDSPVNIAKFVEVFGIPETKNIFEKIPFLKVEGNKISSFEEWFPKQIKLSNDVTELSKWQAKAIQIDGVYVERIGLHKTEESFWGIKKYVSENLPFGIKIFYSAMPITKQNVWNKFELILKTNRKDLKPASRSFSRRNDGFNFESVGLVVVDEHFHNPSSGDEAHARPDYMLHGIIEMKTNLFMNNLDINNTISVLDSFIDYLKSGPIDNMEILVDELLSSKKVSKENLFVRLDKFIEENEILKKLFLLNLTEEFKKEIAIFRRVIFSYINESERQDLYSFAYSEKKIKYFLSVLRNYNQDGYDNLSENDLFDIKEKILSYARLDESMVSRKIHLKIKNL